MTLDERVKAKIGEIETDIVSTQAVPPVREMIRTLINRLALVEVLVENLQASEQAALEATKGVVLPMAVPGNRWWKFWE